MNYVMLFIVIAIMILGWINQHNRIYMYLIIAFFFLIICFSYDRYDYINYNRMYNQVAQGMQIGYEPFFVLLLKMGNVLKLSYDQLRMICVFCELSLIHSTIKRYVGNNAFIWSMFLVFPGWMLTASFRFSIGFSIMIYGIRFLVEDFNVFVHDDNIISATVGKGKKINLVKFALCVIIAASFHNSFWIMMLLLLIKFISQKKLFWSSLIMITIVFFIGDLKWLNGLFQFLHIRGDLIEIINKTQSRSFNGIMYNFLRQMIIFMVGYLAVYWYRYNRDGSAFVKLQDQFMSTVISANYVAIMFLGISLVTSNTRLSYFIILYNLIACGISINIRKGRTIKTLVLKGASLGLGLLLSILMCTMESSTVFEMVLKMIFETNEFINLFG